MSGNDVRSVWARRRVPVVFGGFAAVAVVAAVAFPGIAVADPGPDPVAGDPVPPAASGPVVPVLGVPLGANGLDVLAQSNAPAVPGELGSPSTMGLTADTVLGQYAVPTAPGAGPGTPPNLNVFNNAYGAGALNTVPSAPGAGQQFGVAPGDENADVTRRQWFGHWIDLQRAGRTYGGLGQLPQQQLGEPLPGTAPPPGTVIPPGLVQFLPDPADGPTPPPGLILPPPPPES
jgi:hypothetical protein